MGLRLIMSGKVRLQTMPAAISIKIGTRFKQELVIQHLQTNLHLALRLRFTSLSQKRSMIAAC